MFAVGEKLQHCLSAMVDINKSQEREIKPDAAIALLISDALKISIHSAWVTWVYFGVAVGITYIFFSPIVPEKFMIPWALATAVFYIVWLGINISLTIVRPNAETLARDWEPWARMVTYVSNLIVIATIWLFLPSADERLRLIMIMFYMAMAPTQILARPNNNIGKMLGIIGILGSVAIFLANRPEPYAPYMTLFIVAYTIVMLLFANSTRRLVGQLAAAQVESNDAKARLEQAISMVAAERDAKTQFIATASHDLAQPLQAASLFFDQTLKAPSETHRNGAIEGTRKALAAADQLLAHMLNHLRLEADAVDPQISQIALGPFFARMVAQYQPTTKMEGLEIISVKTSAKIRTDKILLERAIGNLITNAAKHSRGSRVLIGLHRGFLGRLRIWVIDDGVGIDKGDAEAVFEAYYRGKSSRNHGSSGFGLGLSSVARIAKLLDGKAGLDSRWRNGAAFYLDFPAQFGSNKKGMGLKE